MVAYLEHANITVPDIDAAIAFLKVVEPNFVYDTMPLRQAAIVGVTLAQIKPILPCKSPIWIPTHVTSVAPIKITG